MAYRVFETGREPMMERGGEPQKLMKYIDGVYAMLEEMESCIHEMDGMMGERGGMGYGADRGNYGERDDYGYGERRSRRTGRYIRG